MQQPYGWLHFQFPISKKPTVELRILVLEISKWPKVLVPALMLLSTRVVQDSNKNCNNEHVDKYMLIVHYIILLSLIHLAGSQKAPLSNYLSSGSS